MKYSNKQNVMNRLLLFGNGFSIAYKSDIFTYKSLLEQADFNTMLQVEKVFSSLGVSDFELIIKTLHDAATVFDVYQEHCKNEQ